MRERELSSYLIWWLTDTALAIQIGMAKEIETVCNAMGLPKYIQESLKTRHDVIAEGQVFTSPELQRKIKKSFNVPVLNGMEFPFELSEMGGILIDVNDYEVVKTFAEANDIGLYVTDTLMLVEYLGDMTCLVSDLDLGRVTDSDISAAEFASGFFYYTEDDADTIMEKHPEHRTLNNPGELEDEEDEGSTYQQYMEMYEGLSNNKFD